MSQNSIKKYPEMVKGWLLRLLSDTNLSIFIINGDKIRNVGILVKKCSQYSCIFASTD